MTILNIIEYKEEGVAIVEDDLGKYVVTENDPGPISLDSWSGYRTVSGLERDRLLT
jgi:hypothetical protein